MKETFIIYSIDSLTILSSKQTQRHYANGFTNYSKTVARAVKNFYGNFTVKSYCTLDNDLKLASRSEITRFGMLT